LFLEDKNNANKYKALLQDDKKEDTNKGMEITWGIDLQKKVQEKTKENLRKEAGLGEQTPFEQMMKKKKEKKKLKRQEKKSKKEDNDSEGPDDAPFSDDDLPSDADDLKEELMKEIDSKKNKGKKKRKGKKNEDSVDSIDEKEKVL
jgi:hypothetical protein